MTTKQAAEMLKPLLENVNINFSTLVERFELTQSQSDEQILSDNDIYKAVSIISSKFTKDELSLIISLNELCEEFNMNPKGIVHEMNLLKENSKQEEVSEELPEITNEEIMEIGDKLLKCVEIMDKQKIDVIDDFEKFVSTVENNLTKRELTIVFL